MDTADRSTPCDARFEKTCERRAALLASRKPGAPTSHVKFPVWVASLSVTSVARKRNAPKLVNLNANLALAGVNGSGKSKFGVTGLVGSPAINPGCRDPQRPTEAGSVCARRRCHPAWRRCAAVRADRGARSRKQQPAHHQRRYQSPCSDPCTRFNSAALELAVARDGGCAGGAKRPIPDRRSARRTA
jgi:hypothetical protein